MVLQYQNELLALAAIFLLILIYLGIKQKNKAETDTKAAKKEEALKAEQSGQSTATPQKKIQEKKIQHSVPRHAKITKEDFKIFAGERILLAEDNLINQKVILGVLGDSGIEVVVANDGQEALDILKTDKNFLIILMDAHMPRVDGFEATRAIRHDPQTIISPSLH
ncbi:response regulator [Sulfurimonas sp. NW9]|uniref:response regulator n=1 Tax=Sulfurimonas sp. NW9 TaxID=2922728 RepID=UPI003DA8821A